MAPRLSLAPRSLVGRLTAVAAAASAVALSMLLAGLYFGVTAQLNRSIDDGLKVRAGDLQELIAENGPAELDREPFAELHRGGALLVPARGLARAGTLLPESMVRDVRTQAFATVTVTPAHGDDLALRVLARRLPGGEVLVVGTSLRIQQQASDRLLAGLAVAGPVLLALVAFAVARTARAALGRVDALTAEAGRISAAEDTARRLPPVRGDDEIARLTRTFDAMLGRLEAAFLRERSFVDDASHELRGPVAVLRGELELALADLTDTAALEHSLQAALREAERLSRVCEDLLVLARTNAGILSVHEEPVELRSLLHEQARRHTRRTGPDITVVGASCWLLADPGLLERVLGNLIDNASAARARNVRLGVDCRPGQSIEVSVEDDGPGFPSAFLAVAFERFSRADTARTRSAGAGLGLAIVEALMRASGGGVRAGNGAALGGAVVTLCWPEARAAGGPEP